MALRICKAVIKDNKIISSARTVDQLLEFIKPLLMDDEQGGKEESFEFEEGQESVARLVHMIAHPSNADNYYDLLLRFKKMFSKGGVARQKYTYPALFFALIRLSVFINYPPEQLRAEEVKADNDGDFEAEPAPTVQASQPKIFKNLSELIGALQSSQPDLTLRLNLQAAQAINNLRQVTGLEDQAYEFMSNAYIIFEEEVTESEAKVVALNLIVSTLYTLTCFGGDNFDTLSANAVSYSNKLLKKNLQAEAICLASHLYFCTSRKQGT